MVKCGKGEVIGDCSKSTDGEFGINWRQASLTGFAYQSDEFPLHPIPTSGDAPGGLDYGSGRHAPKP